MIVVNVEEDCFFANLLVVSHTISCICNNRLHILVCLAVYLDMLLDLVCLVRVELMVWDLVVVKA